MVVAVAIACGGQVRGAASSSADIVALEAGDHVAPAVNRTEPTITFRFSDEINRNITIKKLILKGIENWNTSLGFPPASTRKFLVPGIQPWRKQGDYPDEPGIDIILEDSARLSHNWGSITLTVNAVDMRAKYIRLNRDYYNRAGVGHEDVDKLNTVVHELGHALGLDHPPKPYPICAQVMTYPGFGGCSTLNQPVSPHREEVAYVKCLYGLDGTAAKAWDVCEKEVNALY
ncbi:hypothetical protein ABZX75_34175 [Streptomyces sp. NPDC003038]|uniref:hypothetical protein n=1 Tax=unclassified Streptomyces TaxID=2593676 RepID=UPI0033BAD303